ncbi:MAG TPA: choice-of-anchor Q domain-containing protein [Solirubrobacteraceae bacterium]|jgi:hypothetical protein|nr:choice-of-anchor Q domain-containing protein [Solirubrobacteraceae bacterium]
MLLALVGAAGLAASAQATTVYTVGTLEDLTGTCPNPASGTCSLRQLIEYEDSLPPHPEAADGIIVPSGGYNLSHGALLITQTVVISAAGARTTNVNVPAGLPAPQRVFEVKPPVNGGAAPTVVITGLTISGGSAVEELNGPFGGDIYNSGSLLLAEDWVTGGSASSGGGVSNDAGTLLLQRSLVSGNHANSGGGDSGGIQNHGAPGAPGTKAVLVLEDSTVAENDARLGAGIYSWSPEGADGNQVTVIESTIAHNTTREEAGGPVRGPGAGLLVADGSANVLDSILAFNKEESIASNCSTSGSGTITSPPGFGHNIESGTDCGFQSAGDLQGTNPRFSSETPQNNGGNTNTLYLEPTSPAIDAIPANEPFCTGRIDQRGLSRPQGAGCDIGAVEFGNLPTPPPPPPPTPAPAAPTLLTSAPPSVLTTTSATFTATVNPNGLPTTVHFEYGGVFGGATIAAVTYGSSTPNQSLPADFANHTVTATVTGLLPNVTYHVRAVATNSAGSALGPDQILQTAADPPPPPPVLGKTANVAPVSGVVYIELPPGATLASFSRSPLPTQAFAALTKGRAFIPLTEARQIPLGSTLDTSAGVVRITTATTASPKGKLQSGDFGTGIFKLLQARKQRGLTELNIIDNRNERQICASTGKGKKRARIAAGHPSKQVLGRLTANSHGHFTARGQYSSATVRGTIWGVQNRCDGTLTRVVRGELSVRDFRKRKTITLFTGQTYLARAPRR